MHWWDNAGLATWVLVVVGIVGTRYAIKTLLILSTQTEALIASERAWIMAEVEWPLPHEKQEGP